MTIPKAQIRQVLPPSTARKGFVVFCGLHIAFVCVGLCMMLDWKVYLCSSIWYLTRSMHIYMFQYVNTCVPVCIWRIIARAHTHTCLVRKIEPEAILNSLGTRPRWTSKHRFMWCLEQSVLDRWAGDGRGVYQKTSGYYQSQWYCYDWLIATITSIIQYSRYKTLIYHCFAGSIPVHCRIEPQWQTNIFGYVSEPLPLNNGRWA